MSKSATSDNKEDVDIVYDTMTEEAEFKAWAKRGKVSSSSSIPKSYGIIVSPDDDGTYDVIWETAESLSGTYQRKRSNIRKA